MLLLLYSNISEPTYQLSNHNIIKKKKSTVKCMNESECKIHEAKQWRHSTNGSIRHAGFHHLSECRVAPNRDSLKITIICPITMLLCLKPLKQHISNYTWTYWKQYARTEDQIVWLEMLLVHVQCFFYLKEKISHHIITISNIKQTCNNTKKKCPTWFMVRNHSFQHLPVTYAVVWDIRHLRLTVIDWLILMAM